MTIDTDGYSCGTRNVPIPFPTQRFLRATVAAADAEERENQMTETNDAVITEALSVIDKALAQMMQRELVSSGEITDVLLDVRTLLTMPAAKEPAGSASS